ncbi:MAG: HAD family hydrolase [Firmicutes bacterium]|nr:HAD family hydrolase [Bacillota bacterium]
MPNTPVTTVLWDFNGTILDDAGLNLRVVNAMLARRGLPLLSAERYLEIMDFPVVRMYERAGFDLARESFADSVAPEFIAMYQPESLFAPLRPGVLEKLGEFRRNGVRQILLSASKLDLLLEQVGAKGLTPFFDAVLGQKDIFASSKTGLAREWMRENGADPAETLVIGDTTHDFAVARELGCRCVLVTGGHNSGSRLAATGAPVAEDIGGVNHM